MAAHNRTHPARKTSTPRGPTTSRKDVHDTVTSRIIAMLETAEKSGAELPWCRPGVAHSRPTNVVSKQRYRGINVLSLWAAADAANYTSGLWATFKQWAELGASVRKGETATPVVFYKPLQVADDTADLAKGDDPTKTIRLIKGFWAFNADQVRGYTLPELPVDNLVERVGHAEAFFAALRIPIHHGGSRAFYRPADDCIQMPEQRLFRHTATSSATEGYLAVLGHEAGHASGAKHRLARDLSGRFGTAAYAMEELVAELTAAFLCADLGITAQPRPDHAHYIANWLAVLKNDKAAVFTAAATANKAAEFLHGLQPPAALTGTEPSGNPAIIRL